ncbi:conserved hypothetical protein [Histoplasma capsulatum var. duboisii H88]|nr:conserved hypothetical protein [Histoplasma capsulatum var. duboisii H88]
MAPRQKGSDARNTGYLAKPNIRKSSQQLLVLKVQDQGKRPQRVRKKQPQDPVRRSGRLQRRHRIEDRTVLYHTGDANQNHPYSPSTSNTPRNDFPENPTVCLLARDRVQKRPREAEKSSCIPAIKRRRTFLASDADDPTLRETSNQVEEQRDITNWNKVDLIRCWCKNNRWPKEYFEAQPGQIDNMNHLLAKKKSTASLRRTDSLATGFNTSTDQEPRDGKSAKYRSASYEAILATRGSFMTESELEVTAKSKQICKMLLDEKQTIPKGTIFQNNRFRKAYQKLQGKNESRIVQDISRLIVPSAETLATFGAKTLECLVESVNEQWGSSIVFWGPRPQPDYAVGFSRSAFTEDQLKKLEPFTGYDPDTYSSFFMATFYMYFPFLTSEVKGTAALDIADRQNAHSMTLAVRGVVELFKLVGREDEVNREILAFSISHDSRAVRIYGHYAVIEGSKTSFYRHPIRIFGFTEVEGRDRWTAYTFTRNVYEKWAPDHLKRIRSAIDGIPSEINFDVQ